MKVYQPVSGLRPVVVDPQLPNFSDTRLTVRCIPGELLNAHDAGALCEKVSALFENQGAEVRDSESGFLRLGEAAAPPPLTDLTLEIRARETDESLHPVSWLLFIGTLTVLPGVMESSFAQEIVIRDGSGFLLVSDTFEGRIVSRYGFGAWFGNTLLDLGRKKVDKLGKESANRDLSKDIYGQLSQAVFNAKMHAQVLAQATPVGRAK